MTFYRVLFLLIFANSLSFAQTKPTTATKINKTATQNWIKEKLETFSPIAYDFYTKQDEVIIRTVTFDNCKIYIKDTGAHAVGYEVFEIPLDDIYIPTFYSDPNWSTNMEMTFRTQSSKKSIVRKLVFYDNPASNETEYVNQISIKIHKRSVQENMIDRFKKAFKDIINVCGGKINELY